MYERAMRKRCGGSEALQGDEKLLNDDGEASKGNWEAFRAM